VKDGISQLALIGRLWRFTIFREPSSSSGQNLSDRRAETKTVAVRIGNRKFTQAPGLVDWRGMNRGFWPLAGVQTPRAKGRISLIHVIDKNAIKRSKATTSAITVATEARAILTST